MQNLVLTVEDIDLNKRIDKYLAEEIEYLSRSSITKLIENNNVLVNKKPISKSYIINPNDVIELFIEDPKELDIESQDIPLDIVYEDDDLLVVNKPKGMVVHPAAGNYKDTLVNALLYHCKDSLSGINGILRPGIVHRIDKNTSGLLIVAKNDSAHNYLAEQIKNHSFTREYKCIVYGNIKDDKGTINAPIGRNKNDRKKMCVTECNSKNAITHYTVLERFNDFTYLNCKLETGRTHQIRVHMAYIGHPLAGDDVYGPKNVIKSLNGQCLHAYKLGFLHPNNGQYLEFSSDVPPVFNAFLTKLRNSRK